MDRLIDFARECLAAFARFAGTNKKSSERDTGIEAEMDDIKAGTDKKSSERDTGVEAETGDIKAGTDKKSSERDTGVEAETGDIKAGTKPDSNADTKADSCRRCHCCENHTAPGRKSTGARKEGWKRRPHAEFPWRLEQVVEQEENWRGTWVLEVKDMQAMDWGTTHVPKAAGNGRGGRYQRQPTRHLPFPVDGDGYRETLTGGQDDLMMMLGRR